MLRNKWVVLSPIIVAVVVFIFSLVLIPTVHPTPQQLPVAFVNEDEGVQWSNQPPINMGKTIEQAIQNMMKSNSAGKDQPPIEWIQVDSEKKAKKGMDRQDYYGALMIPKDFSKKVASLQTPNPSSPKVKIVVNQGMNAAASAIVQQILNQAADHINANVRQQLLQAMAKKGGMMTAEQAALLASPVGKEIAIVHPVGTHSANGNAPVSFVQPIWMASLAAAVLLYLAIDQRAFTHWREKLAAQVTKTVVGLLLALIAGFGLIGMADAIGFHIPSFLDMALFVSLVFFSFFAIESAVFSWVGLKGIPIFILLLFFGAPLLSMAPESMTSFYRDWVYSWLPQRFMVEGLRELFFFDPALQWNEPVSVLCWLALAGVVLVIVSAFKKGFVQESDESGKLTRS
ncbi:MULTISPECIES: YhgE/Pip domain-containing protein [Geobacillus]|uniref:YhgE/Pip domain-containing protein n=1 Tax=Geobacillus TaxID=129337 RepID=UPI0004742B4F|nr:MULTISPECIES: DUF3533 domain-containing protein [Geobacillus]AST00968.1 phage infection protein [Geobacillus thermocatenulatus]KLR72338.1 phage infection protein [Geobacillus sp. T6]